jgi:hypothetical protein
VKFGSTTPVDMHDLLFEDLLIWDSNAGLSIQARDEGTISNVTFRNIIINGTRQWPGLANASGQEWGGWWGSGENIWISTMPRTATSIPGRVQNITFENVWGVGQNANFLSGRSPGNTVLGVRMINVTLVIDRWPSWNYSHPGKLFFVSCFCLHFHAQKNFSRAFCSARPRKLCPSSHASRRADHDYRPTSAVAPDLEFALTGATAAAAVIAAPNDMQN